MDDLLPVIIGVGQLTQRPGTDRPREPLALMAEAARLSAADAGNGDILQSLDSLRVVNVLSWPGKAPARDLARAIGVAPREQIYTAVGGNTPQWQVNEVADAIHRGELSLALIAGAESMYSARRAATRGVDLGWSPRGNPDIDTGDVRPGSTAHEVAHGLSRPTSVYPLFENALRAKYGHSIGDHQAALGRLCEGFSAVAAGNPHAWFPEARSAEAIATVTPGNRYIGFPYPKYMNAIIDVDQGAALLVASVAAARRLGVPEDRWVYLWSWGDATDLWHVSDRVDYHSSPAIRAAGARALNMAGVTIDEVRHLDLYSCFPSAVQISRDMLGIAPADKRPLTVTGGLPYFGGPGNNYVTHSIASMAERLRADRGGIGLVTANGWYVTKHSIGIYSTDPPRNAWQRVDPEIDQATIDAEPHPELIEEPSGVATVETYTVLHDRDGAPERGIVVGRDQGGRRFLANTAADRALFDAMTASEFVGVRGRVQRLAGSTTNTFTPE